MELPRLNSRVAKLFFHGQVEKEWENAPDVSTCHGGELFFGGRGLKE